MNVDESYFKWPQDGFTENKDDETFHLTCTLLYLMAGRGDIDAGQLICH